MVKVCLNLPTQIYWAADKKINYLYNAAGVKVKKTVRDGNTQKVVDYLDGFQYAGGILQFFPHTEGYVKATPGLVSPGNPPTNYFYNYVYNYTDHLGNVRLSYSLDPLTQQLKMMDENHYYPFGLRHSVYAAATPLDFKESPTGPGTTILTNVLTTSYQYKFNGKELQDELGLGMYDYGARNYDPALGRWMNIDLLGEMYETYSPYSYVVNNPLKFIDPSGMWIDVQDGDNRYRYNKGKFYTKNDTSGEWDVEANVESGSYAVQILSSLNEIGESSFGETFLSFFSNDNMNAVIQSSDNFEIKGERGKNFARGKGVFTDFNQNVYSYTSMSGEKPIKTASPFYVTLFHELGHVWANQSFKSSALTKPWISGERYGLSKDVAQSEIIASHIENIFRAGRNLPIRISYSPDAHSATTLVEVNSIKWQPIIYGNKPENTQMNLYNRVFTMPNSVQTIYNQIRNNK